MNRNPYFPNRKIRHAKLLKEAGFEIDMRWYKNENGELKQPKGFNPKPTNCSKLIYWKRGDIRVTLADYQQISLKELVRRVEEQVKYNCKQKAKIVFTE